MQTPRISTDQIDETAHTHISKLDNYVVKDVIEQETAGGVAKTGNFALPSAWAKRVKTRTETCDWKAKEMIPQLNTAELISTNERSYAVVEDYCESKLCSP